MGNPQEEVKKVMTIQNKHYPMSVYNKFTPAEKAKLWNLKNLRKTPEAGTDKKTNKSAATVASSHLPFPLLCQRSLSLLPQPPSKLLLKKVGPTRMNQRPMKIAVIPH
jgi:hypothetical protein